MNKFQKIGIGVVAVGLLPIIVVLVQAAGQQASQGHVSGGSDVVAWILKMFAGGGTLSIGGIITFIYGLIQKYKGLTPVSPVGPATDANGVVILHQTPEELAELAMASMGFIQNRGSRPAQLRFAAAVAGVADAIPGMKASMDGGDLVTRLKLFDVVPAPSPIPPVSTVPVASPSPQVVSLKA